MTDLNKETELDTAPELDELSLLKSQATEMGINFSGNIGLDTLRKKVQEHIAVNQVKEAPVPKVPSSKDTVIITDKHVQESKRRACSKLIRIQITNNNPATNTQQGTILAAQNSLGSWKKFIPFNEPWYVEKIIVNALREATHLRFKKRIVKGIETSEGYLVPTYIVNELPALTKEEIAKLASAQAATRSLEEDV